MARVWVVRLLITIGGFTLLGSGTDHAGLDAGPPLHALTVDERSLVDFALGRFDTHGLELPELNFVFHDDLMPCQLHLGRYHRKTRTLEMCSLDQHTMLHELAHAWANVHLTEAEKASFVLSRGLDSWNDHDHPWERRGTEHVAETIAWALDDHPTHLKWVDTHPDGSQHVTHRILTLGIDVETLLDNFRSLTGQDPLFRDAGEWSDDKVPAHFSPELARLGS